MQKGYDQLNRPIHKMSPEETKMCIDCGTGHLDSHEPEVCPNILTFVS